MPSIFSKSRQVNGYFPDVVSEFIASLHEVLVIQGLACDGKCCSAMVRSLGLACTCEGPWAA